MEAGWYIDPNQPGSGRYHDGTIWTEMTVDIPPGKTLPPAPQDGVARPAPSERSGGLVPVSQGPLKPPPSNRPKSNPNGPAEDGPARTATAQLAKPPKPAASERRRLVILLGVLVAVVVAGLVVYLLKHNDDSTTGGSAATTVTTTPQGAAASSACRLAFAQQLSNPSPSGIPGTFLTCTPQQWVSAYQQSAGALGQTHVDGHAALQAGCLTLRTVATPPAACAGVAPPTPGR